MSQISTFVMATKIQLNGKTFAYVCKKSTLVNRSRFSNNIYLKYNNEQYISYTLIKSDFFIGYFVPTVNFWPLTSRQVYLPDILILFFLI